VGEGVGVQGVVVVEQADELAAGHRQGVVRGGDDAGIALPVSDPDARVSGRRRVEDLAHLPLLGAVVDEAQLPILEALAKYRPQHLPQHAGRRLVDGGEDGEARCGHGRASFARAGG
jgi:hypothetical protein